MKTILAHRASSIALLAAVSVGCTVVHDPETHDSTETPDPSTGGAPAQSQPECRELVWDDIQRLPLDPLYGVTGNLYALVPGPQDVTLVSRERPDQQPQDRVLTTRIHNPFGSDADPRAPMMISQPVERARVDDGRWKIRAMATGAAEVHVLTPSESWFGVASVSRVRLPADEGLASTVLLPGTEATAWDGTGNLYAVRREIIEAYPTTWGEERLWVENVDTGEEIVSYESSLFQYVTFVPEVGRGALLFFFKGPYADWFSGTLLLTTEGTSEVGLDNVGIFGHGPKGTLGITYEDDEIVTIQEDGQVGSVVTPLPDSLGGTWRLNAQVLPWLDGFALVTSDHETSDQSGMLRVRLYRDAEETLTSEPLPANDAVMDGLFAVVADDDSPSLLVAYELPPGAGGGAYLARLRCQ